MVLIKVGTAYRGQYAPNPKSIKKTVESLFYVLWNIAKCIQKPICTDMPIGDNFGTISVEYERTIWIRCFLKYAPNPKSVKSRVLGYVPRSWNITKTLLKIFLVPFCHTALCIVNFVRKGSSFNQTYIHWNLHNRIMTPKDSYSCLLDAIILSYNGCMKLPFCQKEIPNLTQVHVMTHYCHIWVT